MDVEKLARSVDRALGEAHAVVRSELLSEPYGLIESTYGPSGSWETAEAIGILRWEESDKDLLSAGVEALIDAQRKDGGFAPWPDLASLHSYCESTARVLLSIAPVCALAPEYKALHDAVRAAANWIFKNQSEDGGWGAYRGLAPRMFPTCFAIQALAAARRAGAGVKNQRCGQAIAKAAAWIDEVRNDDGGVGVRPGEKSNHVSSCHAAWGLTAANAEVPAELRDYVLGGLQRKLPDIVKDPVDDPKRETGGRFDVLILGAPTALVGAVSVRADIYGRRIIRLVEELLKDQHGGRWRSPEGRFVWPTYMHVAALRLWLAVHRSFARASTSDFRTLQPGSVGPREQSGARFHDPAAELPTDWQPRLESLSPRERQALVAYAMGHPYKLTGEELGVSFRTVENYKRQAFQKLGIKRDGRAVAFSVASLGGLLPSHDEILAKHLSP